MKTSLLLGATVGLFLLAGTASAATTEFTVILTGAQEVPPVTTKAGGSGALQYDDTTKELTGTLTLGGLADATAAHIHEAACGESGDAVVTLTPDAKKLTIDATLDAATETALLAGNLYVNVHTTANPNGELRGQILHDELKCGGGDDAGASSSSGSGASSSSGSVGASSSGSNGAVTTRPSDTTKPASSSSDDGGCSTTGGAPASGAVIGVGVGLALAALSRGRRALPTSGSSLRRHHRCGR
jgi:hypothetical protein